MRGPNVSTYFRLQAGCAEVFVFARITKPRTGSHIPPARNPKNENGPAQHTKPITIETHPSHLGSKDPVRIARPVDSVSRAIPNRSKSSLFWPTKFKVWAILAW